MSNPGQRVLLMLLNGKAAQDGEIRTWVKQQREQGQHIEVRALWEAGQASTFAVDAPRLGCNVVVAAGGDGTLNETVNGLMQIDADRPALALLPYGTANDFATAGGVTELPLDEALDLTLTGTPTPIDIARANERYFLNVASGGFPAEITTDTPAPLKRLLGGFAYSLTGLVKAFDANARQVKLRAPGFHWDGHLLFLAVANGQCAGGGMQVAPQARLNDGKLDVLIVPDGNLPAVAAALEAILHGHESEAVVRAQVEQLEVSAPEGLQVNVDGEPVFAKQFHFEILPGKLAIILPAESPLVAKR